MTKQEHERNPLFVGMVYEIETLGPGHDENRIKLGDVLLCVEHTGDCHYTWAHLAEQEGTDEERHFNINRVYPAYAVTGRELLSVRMSAAEIVSALSSLHTWSPMMGHNKPTAVVVMRSEEEVRERRRVPCPTCGHVKEP